MGGLTLALGAQLGRLAGARGSAIVQVLLAVNAGAFLTSVHVDAIHHVGRFRLRAALSPTPAFRERTVGTAERFCSASRPTHKYFQLKALPPGWALPPAGRSLGRPAKLTPHRMPTAASAGLSLKAPSDRRPDPIVRH
jgi:hypothetical protein